MSYGPLSLSTVMMVKETEELTDLRAYWEKMVKELGPMAHEVLCF
jgi:hypothetical protein